MPAKGDKNDTTVSECATKRKVHNCNNTGLQGCETKKAMSIHSVGR